MRTKDHWLVLGAVGVVAVVGCSSSGSNERSARSRTKEPAYRSTFNADNNPTVASGRGTPSLEDPERPAAWVLVDGKQGIYRDHDGHKQLQWVVEDPVTPTPTFRVEGFQPLLGSPRDFRFMLKSIETPNGSGISYAVSASRGTFAPGKEYSLLRPGDNFVIRNWTTGDVVREIAPLPPGTYVLAADVRNEQAGKGTAAVTYFTVGEE